MARLNEPPIIGESVEALKRRFMRQNRELAKSNSELKIKVATLEADRAQLLSENITLRGQNNHLTQEQARDYTKRAIQNVGLVKEKLFAKVTELNQLMNELEIAQAKPTKQESAPNLARRRSYKRSPTHFRNWKNSLHGPEVTGLAPILEDKCYPRRTLGADEIQDLLPDFMSTTNSPDLGSPPVAHFETSEPFLYDMPQCREEVQEKRNVDDRYTSPTETFSNLETRRKRRTSALMRHSIEESDPVSEAVEPAEICPPENLLKIGAKRKFGNREQAHEVRPVVPEVISFSFSRKSGATVEKPPHRQLKALPERNVSKVAERARTIVSEVKARKALSEKPINTDPVMSPVKLRVVNEKSDPPKLIEKVKERQKQRNQLKVEEKAKKSVPAPVEIPPVTPSPSEADLFSPTESMASSVPGIRDTPPPSELLSKAAENTRPSRRQRAQVSYVEPSLRDKMRRPGKGLADAVIIGKPIKDALHDVVKLEDVSMSNWMSGETRRDASEPISPLQSKSLQAEESLPRTVGTNNRGKSTTPLGDMDINDPKSDISRSTIAALMSSQRRLSRVQEGEICRSMEDCGGEDTNKSSPESFERKESKLVKQSRRHSSMSDVRSKKEASSRSKASECKMDSEQLSASRAERIASRRRSMQL